MIYLWADFLRAFLTPVVEQPPAPEPPFDGRMFAWQRTRGGARGQAMPVVFYDIKVGGMKEYVGPFHLLKVSEYGDDLSTLAARYVCPPIEDDQ